MPLALDDLTEVKAVLSEDGSPFFPFVPNVAVEVAKLGNPLSLDKFAHLVKNGFFLGCRCLKCRFNIKATARGNVRTVVLCF